MAHLTLLALLGAFVAGLLSFFSPCVLPLTPIYLAQLAGPAIWQEQWDGQRDAQPHEPGTPALTAERALVRRATVLNAAAFVAGFSLAFIALGATASVLGAFLSAHAEALRRVGGLVLVAFGLHVAGVLRLPGIDRELRFSSRTSSARGGSARGGSARGGSAAYPFSFLVGLIFGLGWTPCVGPLLAGILLLAARAATLAAGVLLLAVYSLGLGVPFLALALAFDRLAPTLKRLTPHLWLIEIGTGILLVLMGFVIFFNWLIYASAWVRLPSLGLP